MFAHLAWLRSRPVAPGTAPKAPASDASSKARADASSGPQLYASSPAAGDAWPAPGRSDSDADALVLFLISSLSPAT